ncbi:hypothetical protein KC19_N020600 [Ceratodon purpureus]|nr:hypothetical protein KC19_N020600 [Ceratodon purpureus]
MAGSSSRGPGTSRIWEDPNEQIMEPPLDFKPVKLFPFVDHWIHSYNHVGE